MAEKYVADGWGIAFPKKCKTADGFAWGVLTWSREQAKKCWVSLMGDTWEDWHKKGYRAVKVYRKAKE